MSGAVDLATSTVRAGGARAGATVAASRTSPEPEKLPGLDIVHPPGKWAAAMHALGGEHRALGDAFAWIDVDDPKVAQCGEPL